MSSAAGSSMMDGIYSLDLEKGTLTTAEQRDHPTARSSRTSRTSKRSRHSRSGHHSSTRSSRHPCRDPEKDAFDSSRNSSRLGPFHDSASETCSSLEASSSYDDAKTALRTQEEKAVNILLFLSAPCAGLSLLNAIWTLIALFLTLLSQPVRLCAARPTFGQQLGGLLGPVLNLQLRCIYTPVPAHAGDEDGGSYHTLSLIFAHLLSPFLSLGMAVAAWVLAVYWILAAVVGDPVGDDKRDDGKEAVLGLRRWWESWFCRALKLA